MTMKRVRSVFSFALFGAQVCWMRDEDSQRVSVMAIIPESERKSQNERVVKRMAQRAEKMAKREAQKIGTVLSTGVCVGGNGKDFKATGIADINWSPEIEKKLALSGIPQLQ